MDEQNQNNRDDDGQITLEKLQADLDSAMNGWKRTAADFENYKKRKEAESRELLEFAKEATVVKLLPTIDTLEQALRHLPEYNPSLNPSPQKGRESSAANLRTGAEAFSPLRGDAESDEAERLQLDSGFAAKYRNWQIGINGILLQLDKTLEELGVKKIEAVGKKFDPHFHEAVKEVESEEEDGVIIDELQSGFMLNGKLIRPSQVVVSKKEN
ncbi:MAG: nucleotide exchange factor GrpE [Patescibacteria group bacterium]|nr:nucleotide exchange factor GrpE [Patescibacteria group bacterium]